MSSLEVDIGIFIAEQSKRRQLHISRGKTNIKSTATLTTIHNNAQPDNSLHSTEALHVESSVDKTSATGAATVLFNHARQLQDLIRSDGRSNIPLDQLESLRMTTQAKLQRLYNLSRVKRTREQLIADIVQAEKIAGGSKSLVSTTISPPSMATVEVARVVIASATTEAAKTMTNDVKSALATNLSLKSSVIPPIFAPTEGNYPITVGTSITHNHTSNSTKHSYGGSAAKTMTADPVSTLVLNRSLESPMITPFFAPTECNIPISLGTKTHDHTSYSNTLPDRGSTVPPREHQKSPMLGARGASVGSNALMNIATNVINDHISGSKHLALQYGTRSVPLSEVMAMREMSKRRLTLAMEAENISIESKLLDSMLLRAEEGACDEVVSASFGASSSTELATPYLSMNSLRCNDTQQYATQAQATSLLSTVSSNIPFSCTFHPGISNPLNPLARSDTGHVNETNFQSQQTNENWPGRYQGLTFQGTTGSNQVGLNLQSASRNNVQQSIENIRAGAHASGPCNPISFVAHRQQTFEDSDGSVNIGNMLGSPFHSTAQNVGQLAFQSGQLPFGNMQTLKHDNFANVSSMPLSDNAACTQQNVGQMLHVAQCASAPVNQTESDQDSLQISLKFAQQIVAYHKDVARVILRQYGPSSLPFLAKESRHQCLFHLTQAMQLAAMPVSSLQLSGILLEAEAEVLQEAAALKIQTISEDSQVVMPPPTQTACSNPIRSTVFDSSMLNSSHHTERLQSLNAIGSHAITNSTSRDIMFDSHLSASLFSHANESYTIHQDTFRRKAFSPESVVEKEIMVVGQADFDIHAEGTIGSLQYEAMHHSTTSDAHTVRAMDQTTSGNFGQLGSVTEMPGLSSFCDEKRCANEPEKVNYQFAHV